MTKYFETAIGLANGQSAKWGIEKKCAGRARQSVFVQ